MESFINNNLKSLYSILLNEVDYGIIISTEDGNIVDINNNALKVLGSPSKEATMDINLLEYQPLLDIGLSVDLHNALTNLIKVTGETKYITKWGNNLYLKYDIYPITIDHNILAKITIEDFTEQKKLERESKLNQEIIANTFDALDDLIIVIDKDFNVITSNWQDIKVLTSLGHENKCHMALTGSDSPCKKCKVSQVFSSKSTVAFESSDSYGKYFDVKLIPIFDSDGEIEFVIEHFHDISEKKKVEIALQKSESIVKNKLKAITEPDMDIASFELSDIIDTEVLQSLMENLYQLTGMPGAILDVSGKVLVSVGWQDICTKFHRCNSNTLKNCIESDTILTYGVPEGTFKSYHCKNNMWDIVTPLIVGGKHLGNIFMGQYFLEDEVLDIEQFRKQAQKHGFDEEEYLAALKKVPRFSKEIIDRGMQFYSKLAEIISTLSFSTIKQARLLNERKQAEERLKESQALLNEAQKMGKIGGWEIDINTKVQTWTEETFRILEIDTLNSKSNVLDGMSFFTPKYKDLLSNAIQNAMKYGKPYDMECEIYTAKGNRKWLRSIGKANKIDGEIRTITGSFQDITEQKKLEKESRLNHEIIANTFDSLDDLIVVVDREHNVITSNCLDANPLSDLEKKCHMSSTISEGLCKNCKIHEVFSSKSTIAFENTDNNGRSFEVKLIPIFDSDGEVELVIEHFHDISVRKSNELKLKKLAEAIEKLSESIVITDGRGNIEYVNPAFVKITGYGYEELIGKSPNILSSGVHDNKFYKNLWETILAGNTWHGVFTNKNKNNEFFHEASSISPIFDDKNNIINFVAVKRDVTKEIVLQNQLNESQKLESIGVLASGIAHEINTPLQYLMDNLEYVIDSFTNLKKYGEIIYRYLNMSDEVIKAQKDFNVEFLSSEIPEALKDSLNGVKIIQEIIKSMRVFSHNSKDKQITTEINTYIKSAIEISKNSWKHNADIKLNLTNVSPKIEVNIGQINQVLLNLIVNASDAIKSNNKRNNEITISSYVKNNHLIISVKDTGTGISEKNKNKVFDVFFTTKDVGKGSGQGLSISYDIIVNRHGGKLYFESEKLSGTTFYIELPLFKQDTV